MRALTQEDLSVIQPTIGRVVWFYPAASDDKYTKGPLTALVCHVWSDTCVNLAVFDSNGNPYNRTSVLLWQGDGERPASGFAEWMPYQKGQVAKTEAAEAKLAAA
jgi:hypothetical protein